MNNKKMSRDQIAKRCAQDIPNGAYVNLGIGIPTLVGSHIEDDKEVVFHCENGILGLGPKAEEGKEDPNILDVSAEYVTMVDGGSYINHVDSFVVVRGGHLDFTVMGALQVSSSGDLANWLTNDPHAVPGIGGSMDLAVGSKNVYIVMPHVTRDNQPKIMKECTFSLTASNCVKRIYTDLAVMDITEEGLVLKEIVPGLTVTELQEVTEATLIVKEEPKELIV